MATKKNKSVFVVIAKNYTGDGNNLKWSYTNHGIFTTNEKADSLKRELEGRLSRADIFVCEVELDKEVEF